METWRTILFRICEEVDRPELFRLLEDVKAPLPVLDTILFQLRDSIQSRHPAGALSATELNSLTGEHLRGIPADGYGVWACYPWSRRLVHLLDGQEFVKLRKNRTRYQITPAEQAQLSAKDLGMAGPPVGRLVAAVLALERCFGEGDCEEVLRRLDCILGRSPFYQPEAAPQFASSIRDMVSPVPGIPAGVMQ
jgi:hypothetical protein